MFSYISVIIYSTLARSENRWKAINQRDGRMLRYD